MSTKKAPVSSAQLIKQKQEAESRLDSLRQKQVDALNEGHEPEHDSEIDILKERLVALDSAIGRAEEREEEARKLQNLVDTRARAEMFIGEITAIEHRRIASIKYAEKAFDTFIEHMAKANEHAADIVTKVRGAMSFINQQPETFSRVNRHAHHPRSYESNEMDVDTHSPGSINLRLKGFIEAQLRYLTSPSTDRVAKPGAWHEEEEAFSRQLDLGIILALRYVIDKISDLGVTDDE